MHRNWRTYLVLLMLFLASAIYAQKPVSYKIDGAIIIASIDINSGVDTDSVLISFGFDKPNLNAILNTVSEKGWKCIDVSSTYVKLTLDKNQKVKDIPPSFSINDQVFESTTYFNQPNYGLNRFKKYETVTTKNGVTRFFIYGHSKAKSVYLSGSFNEWSTLALPMIKVINGWEVELELPAGKHLYKFIIDGFWTEDNQNRNKENDWNGGFNSVYYVANQVFNLKGYEDAKKVVLASSFNGWNEGEILMNKVIGGWRVKLFVRPGTHAYKYIVDGEWTLDPENDLVRDDGAGNRNNFMSVGDTFYFRLRGFHEAKEVYCAGNFNAWNWSELKMYKSSKGWIIPYVLAPGNYEYKFKVDGTYITDPHNKYTVGEGDYLNSLKAIEANTTFTLKDNADANNVLLSGTFNSWNPHGYKMTKKGDEWSIDIHLDPGKHLYKYIVDGEWIRDPDNKLWEKNQFDSQNSILWIKPVY